jgi:predicted dithiol-disulfide oxidoreductase (DUF899 family)
MTTALPPVVDADTWARERDALLAAEKDLTRARDALAARRRRLPMTPATNHTFSTTGGPRTLLDLFAGHRTLVVYQFMDHGSERYCGGCTWFAENVPATAPELLAENGVAWAHVSDLPLERLTTYWEARGWTLPYASSRGTTFAAETGSWLTVFVRDGDAVYRTWGTAGRGLEDLTFVTSLLDLTPYGRREEWEDSPSGWPQGPVCPEPPLLAPDDVVQSFGRFRSTAGSTPR